MSLDFFLDCPCCNTRLFERDYTHNVSPMWRRAGIFDLLYQSEDLTAQAVMPTLLKGLAAMKADPEGFRALNPDNGWGDYEGATAFLEAVCTACDRYPAAKIRVSR